MAGSVDFNGGWREGQRVLLDVLCDYIEHGSWRCGHPPHYYLADGKGNAMHERGECPCGLMKVLRDYLPADLAGEFMPQAPAPTSAQINQTEGDHA